MVDTKVLIDIQQDIASIKKVHNYYGMVEQTGSIFMECEYGFFHASTFSEILIRDHANYQSKDIGERGLIQLISVIHNRA